MRASVDKFLQDLVSRKGFSHNTVSAYNNDLNQCVQFLEDDRQRGSWREVTPEDIRAFMLHLRERGYANSTIARKTAAVRSFGQYLVETEIVRSDPAEEMTAPKVAKSAPKAMTPAEVECLFNQLSASNSTDALRDHAMMHLLYGTGMRVSEMVNLDVGDVDLQARVVRCPGSQGRSRQVPINGEVQTVIQDYLSRQTQANGEDLEPDQPLFRNHRGHRLTRQGFWLILKQHAQAAGIDDITPHTLRHSFATHQVMAGRQLEEVQRMLGHVSPATTQIYEKLAADMSGAEPAVSVAAGTTNLD